MTDQNAPYPGPDAQNAPRFVAQASAESTTTVTPQHGIGPYTLREWIVLGAAALLLILSFFSRAQGSTFIGYAPVWTLGIAWVPAVVLPLLSAALIALRRTNNVTNFGSLSVDQLASVSFVGAAITWLHVAVTLGSIASWVTWVALIVSLGGVFFTVFARFVAPFSEDFTGREAVVAHVAARPVRPVIEAPRPVAPAAAPAGAAAYGAAQPNPYAAPTGQQADPFQAPAAQDPFQAPAANDPFQANSGETAGYDRFAAPAAAEATAAPEEAAAPEATAEAAAASTDDSAGTEAYPATQVVDAIDAEQLAEAEGAAPIEGASSTENAPSTENSAAPAEESVVAPEAATPEATPAASQQPFWALVPEERDVHDFEGHAIYKIGPTAWALVLEDRGTYFVMRHDDGRVGYLHNVQGVTRS
ncbi:hypothetical protein GCM10010922_06130 [Microbacterium sorbitolivorans]|uniref:Uncharacterized protein n=1 Tax=Microbacterium sorbitolivorans TaxID=1867410 RepID=A0A367Y5V4_9MICO|nr:hypothetical protein [Microbacterium sorbitolivorans]RCK61253.1 hypothetical protein DTO57_00950 [Microbacterium sorbitolivorans]GGF33723.1 hypothetical protein GCM10010922_06130 [Microbacterium sorbitolivorans]